MYHIDKFPDDIGKGTKSKIMNGVPYTKIPYTSEYYPHATNIACYVLRYEDEKSAEWLMNNIDDDGLIWHKFKLPFYDDFPKEWVGGLAQGLTISALVKMHEKFNKKIYLYSANNAFEGLKKCTDEDGWIHEYPNVPTILNGNLYALLGVYDLMKYYKTKKKFFDKSVTNIAYNLHKYEIGYGWSYYDLEKKLPATKFYHEIHVDLLRVFSVLTGHPVFSVYELKWAGYLDGFNDKYANLHRLWKLWRKDGTLKLLRKRKIRKRWLNGSD